MKLLLDPTGNAVKRGDKLVLVDDANGNKEIEFDPVGVYQKNGQLFGENQGTREKLTAAEAKLATFAGIEDPKAALDALNKVKTIGTKDAEVAAKIEEVRTETTRALEAKYAPVVKQVETLQGDLKGIRLQAAFAGSEFAKNKLVAPPDMLLATFGSKFAEVDGKIIPVDGQGKPRYSVKNPGGHADFEEGLEMVVGEYAHRAVILKGSGASGGGATNNGGGAGGKPTMTRAAFETLDPVAKQTTATNGTVITD